MKRLLLLSIGFLVGIFATVTIVLVVKYWLLSPTRAIEQLTGLDLPSDVSLEWINDKREMFFGQGSTLRAFKIPEEFSNQLLVECPRGFLLGKFAQSGIPENNAQVEGNLPACIFSKETPTRQDTIVILRNKLIYLQIYR